MVLPFVKSPSLTPLAWLIPALLLLLALHATPLVGTLDWAFYDGAQRKPFKASKIPDGSVILLVDEHAMERLAGEPYAMHWPYPRNAFSALLLSLKTAGAKKVVMDFTFVDPSPAQEQDMILAAIAGGMPECVLATADSGAVTFWDKDFIEAQPQFFLHPRTGNVSFESDTDGLARTYKPQGSLAAAACDTTLKVPTGRQLLRWSGGLEELKERGLQVYSVSEYIEAGLPLLELVLEKAPGMDVSEIVPAMNSLESRQDTLSLAVKGKTIFIGANAHGTFDTKTLPIGEGQEPGVLVHWTAWANLMGQGFIQRAGMGWTLGSVGAVLLLMQWLAGLKQKVLAPSLGAVGITILVLGGCYALLSQGVFIPPFSAVFAALCALLCIAVTNFISEQARKREIQAIFGSYVAPSVVELLVNNPEAIKLGGERKRVSILFSDLAGFTDLSEKMSPEKLLPVINLYLEKVSEALLKNGAYIDKYIGDAVMAVYGAPMETADHALAACEGALAAQEAMANLAPLFKRDYDCVVHMRVGVNTGDVIVGNMGSTKKRNYTVLGDPVNLASRLEAANKAFGTAILIGETTAAQVQEHFSTRPLAMLRVKGKLEAIEVHELVGRRSDLTESEHSFLSHYQSGFSALKRCAFEQAASQFTQALSLCPNDKMSAHWHDEALKLNSTNVPNDWIPLIKLDSK